MQQRFEDKVVVITGASAGIGAACAQRFVQEGARVVLAARQQSGVAQVADSLPCGRDGNALVVPTDVADPEACAALLATACDSFGGIDVLVNNAGYHPRGNVMSRSAAELAQTVDVNLRAPVILSRLAADRLRRGGAIVNVASLAGMVPLSGAATYSATKMGLRAFSLALAEELAPSGVRVSLVSPGPVDTGFIMDDLDNVEDIVFAQPMSTADEIAQMVLDCAHDGALERMRPVVSGYLATLGYIAPGLRRLLRPVMERRGRRVRSRLRAARSG